MCVCVCARFIVVVVVVVVVFVVFFFNLHSICVVNFVLEIGLRLFELLICLLSGRRISVLANKDVLNVFTVQFLLLFKKKKM
jgi:hypothetical protein